MPMLFLAKINMENISKHITYAEAIHSNTAKRRGIDNTPNKDQTECMKITAEKIFEPLRKFVGGPIKVTSMFRSADLNKAIKGSKSSQHMKGQALDLDADYYGKIDNSQIFYWIKNNLIFDQLIWEFGDDNNPDWVHVSFSQGMNRLKVMRAIKKRGKTVYELY